MTNSEIPQSTAPIRRCLTASCLCTLYSCDAADMGTMLYGVYLVDLGIAGVRTQQQVFEGTGLCPLSSEERGLIGP
uniref:Uncharacterized protein n=1 Tax=Thermosporothrix sp. COM3 TaxID=2490863 RepID=A0A455SHU0_9CHLR|nr:hypothetical protein KTC_20570 [Thermosporothrix sp. COM3]